MENDDNLFTKIMITILFLAGLLIGLAIGHSKEPDCSYQRSDNFISAEYSPVFIKNETLASMSDDIDVILLAEKIIQCESNWDYTAQNPNSTAYGAGQVIDGTFQWFQEKYNVKLDRHKPEDQLYIVVKLLEDGGYHHWSASAHCWDKEHKYIK